MKIYKKYEFLTFILVATIIMTGSIYAQDSMGKKDTTGSLKEYKVQELVIMAPKDPATVLLTPASVTLINAAEIDRSQITSLKEFSAIVPNLFMPDYGSKLTSPVYIRGIGSRINSPSVGLNVDYAPYFEKAAFDFNLFDIERIEILRGPQGTLYGRNTMGGIINVFTKSPFTTKGTELFYSQGSYGMSNIGAAHYGTIGNNFGFAVNANYLNEEGYFTNTFNNEKVDDMQAIAGRLRLEYLTDNFSIENIMSIDHSKQGGYPYAVFIDSTNTRLDINYNQRSYYDRDMLSDALIVKYNTDNFKIVSISSFQYLTDDQGIDQDFTKDSLYFIIQKQDEKLFSQEIIVKSPVKGNYEWLFGAYGFYQTFDNTVIANVYNPAPQRTNYQKDYLHDIYGYALFHQSTFNNLLIDNLSLTAGLRWDVETDEMNYKYVLKQVPRTDTLYPSLNTAELLPKVALQYHLGLTSSIYATVAKGYKTGGFNTTFERPEDLTFDSEQSWNYEAGVKASFWDDLVFTDLAAFYIDWQNQQIYQTVPSGRGSMLKNAGLSTSKGIEFSVQATPVEDFQANLSFGYTDARFDEYVKDSLTNYNGKFIPYIPLFTIGIGLVKTFDLNHNYYQYLRLSARYNLTGSHYWNESNIAQQETYGILDFTASLIASHFNFDVFVKNILNEDYNSFYFQALGKSYVQQGKPFRFGVKISAKI
jgi:outer membrane receptor protein involved in Fe transport